MFSTLLSPEFHLKVRQLKLVDIRQVTQVNLHENGVALITRDLDGNPDNINIQWADVEQLHLALVNALTLRNIREVMK